MPNRMQRRICVVRPRHACVRDDPPVARWRARRLRVPACELRRGCVTQGLHTLIILCHPPCRRQELAEAVLHQRVCSTCPEPLQRQGAQQAPLAPWVVAVARCALPAGLLLHPASLLPALREADAVMSRYGPEAVLMAAAGAEGASQPSAPGPTETTALGCGNRDGLLLQPPAATPPGAVPVHAAARAADGSGAGAAAWDAATWALPAGAGCSPPCTCAWQPLDAPPHVLELLPADDDPLRAEKLALAGRLGLGSQHFLGPGKALAGIS